MHLVKRYFSRKFGLWSMVAASLAALLIILPSAGQADPDRVYLPIILHPAQPTATNTPPPTATQTPQPTATTVTLPTPTATSALLYICDHDAYNCSDFNTQAEAQTVFDYCAVRGFGDIHKLDQNNDGEACESLPLLKFP